MRHPVHKHIVDIENGTVRKCENCGMKIKCKDPIVRLDVYALMKRRFVLDHRNCRPNELKRNV